MMQLRAAAIACAVAVMTAAASAQMGSGLRGATPLNMEGSAPPIAPPVDSAGRTVRNYPEQPPLIPHSIEGFQIHLNGNTCLSCHRRTQTGQSGAPMVSVTHFTDRDGQVLATLAPRRYFCTECHVPQYDAKPPVKNDFVDIDTMLSRSKSGDRQ